MTLILFVQTGNSQNPMFKKIKSFAEKGNDTTLVLLDRIHPKIDFKNPNDLAFEYYLVKYNYYYKCAQWKEFKAVLEECKVHYEKSDNVYLKLSYDIARILPGNNTLDKLEPKLRKYRAQAIELGFYDLLVEINLHISKMFKGRVQTDSMRYYLDESLRIAVEHNLGIKEGKVLRTAANDSADAETAFKYFDRAKEKFTEEGDAIGAAFVMTQKARRYQIEEYYEKALELFQQALDIFKETNFNHTEVNLYIGNIYQEFGNDLAAIKQFEIIKEVEGESLHPFWEARLKTDIGESYIAIGNVKEGRSFLIEGVALKEAIKDNYAIARSYIVLGKLYLEENKLALAETQFKNAIAINQSLNIINYLDQAYVGLLQMSIRKGDVQTAKKYSELALEFADKNNSPESKYFTFLSLAKLSEQAGDIQKAIQYYKSSVRMHNSAFDFNDKIKITNLITNNENQLKENEILKLKFENQKKEAETATIIQQNEFRSKIYLTILFSILAIFLMFIRSYFQDKKASASQKKLNDSLNESNEKLADSNKQLEQFAHMTSHDLKSPLTTIISYSNLLEKTALSKLNEEEKTYFKIIHNNGNNLADMIDDMLVYSKFGSQNLSLKLVDMDLMMKDTLSSLSGLVKENHILIKQLKIFPNIIADEQKLKRIFQNIITNAIKFSDPNKSEKYLQIDYKDVNNYHQYSISDNGIGIPEDCKNLFEPFTYLNSNTTYKGTGMGLAISKKLVEKHGGEIWYESAVGKGTIFYFTIDKG